MKSISCILLVCLLGLIAYAEETQEQQVQRLIGELQGDDFNVRSYAAYILGKTRLGAKDAVPALIQALEEPAVSYSAAMALGQIGKDAIPALIQSLQDQDFRVSASAAEALVQIGTPEALEAVKEYEKSNW